MMLYLIGFSKSFNKKLLTPSYYGWLRQNRHSNDATTLCFVWLFLSRVLLSVLPIRGERAHYTSTLPSVDPEVILAGVQRVCIVRQLRVSIMGKSKQVGNHKKKSVAKIWKTKRRTKDLDQIHADMIPANAAKLLKQDVDYDVTGSAQHYCLHCSRYFVDLKTMKEHFKTKVHKKRLKTLREEPYTQAEAERAAGMGSYIPPKTNIEVHTQQVEEDMN